MQLTGLVGGKNSTDQCEGDIDSSSFQHVPVMPPQKCWADGEDHLGGILHQNSEFVCRKAPMGAGSQPSLCTSTFRCHSAVAEICICVGQGGESASHMMLMTVVRSVKKMREGQRS